MYIDEDVLEGYLEDPKKFEALCKQKNEIVNWWFKTEKDFETLEKKIGQIQERINPYEYAKQDGSGRDVLNQMIKEYEREKQLFKAYAFVLGGVEFDKNDNALSVDPRIMKIASGDNDFSNDLFGTISKTMSYNLVTNNYPNNLIYFLKKCKDNKGLEESIQKSGLVISHPWYIMGEKSSENTKDWRIKAQKGDLRHFNEKNLSKIDTRFPLKFLWMWMNPDVIHPLSLMAFREFLKSEFMNEIFKDLSKTDFQQCKLDEQSQMGKEITKYAERITNAKIEYFPRLWSKVSNAIMNKLYGENWKEEEKEKKLKEVSLLISLLTLGETDMTNIDELLKTHKQIILYGVPGTGKTHSAKELIRKWSQEEFEDVEKSKRDQDEIDRLQLSKLLLDSENSENVESKQDGGKKIERDIKIVWEIMQFHPNTTYQDFIGGIVPKTDGKGSLSYELRDGKFKEFCEYARVNPKIPFVFIIDEINRANLSEVLGELLYALEYRDEGIIIPNFKEPFVIPSNVYIIGTMNNVDKSLSTFDLALRRRFGFYEVKPDLESLNKILSFEVENQNNSVNDKAPGTRVPLISEMENYITRCKNLNKKIIEKLGDKNAQIGQAYYGKIEHFLNQNEEDQVVTPFHLQKLWGYHLEPLLQEYVGFMDDGEKKVEDLKKVWLGKVEE